MPYNLPGIETWRNPKNGFFVVKVHYTADPRKRSKEWKDKAMKGYASKEKWRREMEIDFTIAEGMPVFGELYNSLVHNRPGSYTEGENLYRGWDFGFVHPACIITKINEQDQWHWIKEFMGHKIVLAEFVVEVKTYCEANYPNAVWWDYCDPITGTQTSGLSAQTSIGLLNSFGIYPIYKVVTPMDRVNFVRDRLALREDKKPGMLVDERQCPISAEALKGGYKLSKVRGEERPLKDGWYEHLMDAAQYVASCLFDAGVYGEGRKSKKDGGLILYPTCFERAGY